MALTVGQVFIVPALLGFGAPWTWLLSRASPPEGRTLEGLIDRVCLGYATSFVILFAVSQVRLWLFAPIWLLGAVACVAVRVRGPQAPPRKPLGEVGRILLVAALFYFVLRCLPCLFRDFPMGWDPYFHLILADSILRSGKAIHDWRPYESMPLNYPIGSHLLLALTSWLTRVRPHKVFDLATALFTTLTGLQIFSFVSRATRVRDIALYSCLAYLFMAVLGSLGYWLWGGLPNLTSMYLFLGLLTSLVGDSDSLGRSTVVLATYLLAACFVHHHVMVTAGLTLVWLWFYFFFLARDRVRAKRILVGLVTTGVVGAPYFIAHLLRIATLGRTSIGEYTEAAADGWSIARDLGYAFALPVSIGVYLQFRRRHSVSPVLPQTLVAMLGLYASVEFVLRTAANVFLHREVAPFTPSRFLTDAVTGLSFFAGVFFWEMEGERATARKQVAALIVVSFFLFNRSVYLDTFRGDLSRAREEVYEWIKDHTDSNALLLEGDIHAAYFARRSSPGMPIPSSEYLVLAANREVGQDVLAGRKTPQSLDRQVVSVAEAGRGPGGTVLFSHPSGLKVVELAKAQR